MRKRSTRVAEETDERPLAGALPLISLRPEDGPASSSTFQAIQADLATLLQQLGSAVRRLAAQVPEPTEQRWEHLSFYAERDHRDGKFYLPSSARRGGRLEEGEALHQLGLVGWQLVAVVPACYNGENLNHQLYLKRPVPAAS
jgi:hypothetical protein